MTRRGRAARLCLGLMVAAGLFSAVEADEQGVREARFESVGTFVVCENTSCDRDEVEETLSEIVAASRDGRTLVYVDAALGAIGFVDIGDPAAPKGLGVVELEGQPTSVAVAGPFVLAVVDTSDSFTAPSGRLDVFDLADCAEDTAHCAAVASHDLGGQPDSVAVSPDGRFAAIVIENQRDEEVVVGGVEGGLPQLPGGLPEGRPHARSPRLLDGDVRGPHRPGRLRSRGSRARVREHQLLQRGRGHAAGEQPRGLRPPPDRARHPRLPRRDRDPGRRRHDGGRPHRSGGRAHRRGAGA